MLDLLSVDFFLIGKEGPIFEAASHPDLCPASVRRQGDNRFLFILNWVFPPHQCVMVGALDPQAPWLTADTPQARAWKHFLEMSPEQQRDAFKIIFSVDEGPWLVRRSVPKKPAIIGRQVKMECRHDPGRHLEVMVDVSSGSTEQVLTGMVMRAMKSLQPVLAVLIEARQEDELPEGVLLCPTLRNLDTSRLQTPVPEVAAAPAP